ncbi:MAG: hypothetical protein AAGD07_07245 [Planctomycetota bacterium]
MSFPFMFSSLIRHHHHVIVGSFLRVGCLVALCRVCPAFADEPLTVRVQPGSVVYERIRRQADGDAFSNQVEANLLFDQAIKAMEEDKALQQDNTALAVPGDFQSLQSRFQNNAIQFNEQLKEVARDLVVNRLPMVQRRARQLTLWDRTFSDPELSRNSVTSGRALNMVLDQLRINTTLGYSSRPPVEDPKAFDQKYPLDQKQLSALRLEIPLPDGSTPISLVDKISRPVELDYLLAHPDFEAFQASVKRARDQVVAEAASEGMASYHARETLENAVAAFVHRFDEKYPRKSWGRQEQGQLRRLFASEKALNSLVSEATQLVDSGGQVADAAGSFLDLYPHPTLSELVHHCLANNLRFKAADAAGSVAYVKLFEQMRNYCATLNVSPSREWVMNAGISPQEAAIMVGSQDLTR